MKTNAIPDDLREKLRRAGLAGWKAKLKKAQEAEATRDKTKQNDTAVTPEPTQQDSQ